jgi:hypothetical protein
MISKCNKWILYFNISMLIYIDDSLIDIKHLKILWNHLSWPNNRLNSSIGRSFNQFFSISTYSNSHHNLWECQICLILSRSSSWWKSYHKMYFSCLTEFISWNSGMAAIYYSWRCLEWFLLKLNIFRLIIVIISSFIIFLVKPMFLNNWN